MRFSPLTVDFFLSGSTLLVTTTVPPPYGPGPLTDLRGPGLCSQQESHRPQQQTHGVPHFTHQPHVTLLLSPVGADHLKESCPLPPASLSYTFSFSREGVRSTIKGVWFPVQINVLSTPDSVFSLTQFPSKGYVSLQGTLSSISPTLDLTLSGDWVQYPTRSLVFPVPESVAAIPSPVETSSGFDPAFSLPPFLSRRLCLLYSLAFLIVPSVFSSILECAFCIL